MPRIIPSLILCAAFGACTTAALAESEGATLDGHWMAIGDFLGLLPGHIESLTIDGQSAVSVLWRTPVDDCAAEPAAQACELPLAVSSGHRAKNIINLVLDADQYHMLKIINSKR